MPLFELFWTMLMFFMFFLWIWVIVMVFFDIFRSDDLSGWGKAGWIILVVLIPWLGVLIYLIVRGRSMQERAIKQASAQAKAQQQYIQQVAGTSAAPADQLAKLAELRESGVLTDEEFQAQKAKILA